jgi:quinol monooxygenase YgiN
VSHYLRVFQSQIDPADVAMLRRLFEEDVRPVFTELPGCLAIELLVNVDHNAGGLVEGCAISRWASLDDLDAALGSRGTAEAGVRLRQVLRQEPVTKVYEVIE